MYREKDNVELKRELTDAVKNEIIAFLNTKGGTIYVGVDDNGELYRPFINEDKDYIDTKLANWIEDTIYPVPMNDVKHYFKDDGVLTIDVSEGNSKPYYLKEKGPRPSGVYKRVGSTIRMANDSEILLMLLDSKKYSYEDDIYLILDKTTKTPIQQIQMLKYRACDDYDRATFMNQLEGFLNSLPRLMPPQTFSGIQNDENIRKAFDSKAAMGRFLCRMKNDNIDVLFYFYKGLFSLAKADILDLDIRFDTYENKCFMATFKPKKKKNPLTFNTYGVAFSEKIHCMFINMI